MDKVISRTTVTISGGIQERKKAIPGIIKEQRLKKGLTQKEVARRLGIPYQDYQKYEYGHFSPKMSRYADLCTALQLPKTNMIYQLVPPINEPEYPEI